VTKNGQQALHLISIGCMHCGKAPCMQACPVKAITKRNDGVVLVDDKKCIGCKSCLWVCPFGAPQFNPVTKLMNKCTLCYSRLEKNLKPACVATCHQKALRFGTTEELSKDTREKLSETIVRSQITLFTYK